MEPDHRAANRANWDARAAVHFRSDFYDVERYVRDPGALSEVVRFDARQLGDVGGLELLHLQCHIGTDSISWARLGAHVVGLDFSLESVRKARELSERSRTPVTYVCADVLDAGDVLTKRFDVVYASVGVLCWISDIDGWARAAAACLKPAGRLYLRDGHPIMDTFDYERDDDQVVCIGDYFGQDGPWQDDAGYTYTGDDVRLDSPVNFQWTHALGSIVTALVDNGLRIERLDELDWLDWQAFPWMVRDAEARWRFPPEHPRLPLAFAITASKPA